MLLELWPFAISGIMYANVLKCHIWIPPEKIGDPFFCRTCFSMGDLGVQVSVHSSVRLSIFIMFVFQSTLTLGVLRAQLLLQFCTDYFETLHAFSSWYEDVHVVWM